MKVLLSLEYGFIKQELFFFRRGKKFKETYEKGFFSEESEASHNGISFFHLNTCYHDACASKF